MLETPPGQTASTMEWVAFPDFHLQIEEQIAEDDRVVNRMVGSATHSDEFMGVPATGKEVSADNVTIFRIAGGKIIERWTVFDAMGMMVQLGVVSLPGEA